MRLHIEICDGARLRPSSWTRTDTTRIRSDCVQAIGAGGALERQQRAGRRSPENCLFLNVYAPAGGRHYGQ
jgi:carboxylesterase type B